MNDLMICKLDNYQHIFVIILVAVIEYWLGKTSKTKSGSIIELILNIFDSMMSRFKKKE